MSIEKEGHLFFGVLWNGDTGKMQFRKMLGPDQEQLSGEGLCA